MDAKDAELYAEENREILLGIQRSLNALATTFSDEIRNLPEPLKSLEVSGKVQVNTEKEIAVSNLGDLEGWLWQLSDTVTLAIKNSAPEPLKSLTVDNIKDAKADKVKITNLGELKKELDKLADVIVTNKPIVQIDKQEVKMPKSATDYVSVRLTDGKRFYNALQAVAQAVSGAGETDPLVGYQICERDDTSYPHYFGYAKTNGDWYIMRETSAGAYRFSKGAPQANGGGLFSDAWTDRANLTYNYVYEVF